MPTIIPAILTNHVDDFKKKLATIKDLATDIQIDITDGQFVPSQTIQLHELIDIPCQPKTEVHLMVNEPIQYLDDSRKIDAQIVLFHLESKNDPQAVIDGCRARQLGVGLVLNPDTQIEQVVKYDRLVDVIQLMGVQPGYYGRSFIPETLVRLKTLRQLLKHAMLAVDGGVNRENIVDIAATGVDRIVVGSAIFKSKDTTQALHTLQTTIGIRLTNRQ